MPRFKLLIEYDGTPFVGWQLQAGGPSVQGLIAEAIAAFCGERVAVYGAGRTDAGVHALGQVAHFDLLSDRDTDTVRDAINAHLRPHPVAVLSYVFWQRRFASDPAMVGSTVQLNGHAFTVVGVASPDFTGTDRSGSGSLDSSD